MEKDTLKDNQAPQIKNSGQGNFAPPSRPAPPPRKPQIAEVEEKEKKQKKSFKLNKKTIIILCSVFGGLLVVGGIVLAILLGIRANAPLELAQNTQVEFVVYSGGAYLQATPQEENATYYFEISVAGETTTLISTNNQIDVSAIVSNVGTYEARLYIKLAGKTSNPSAWVSYRHKLALSAPFVTYNAQDNTLSWQKVENAVSYKVFYSIGSIVSEYDFIPEEDEEDEDGRIIFELSELNLPLGNFVFSVFAVPVENSSLYLPSAVANYVEVENSQQKVAPLSAEYNFETKNLTINATNLTSVEEFKITLHTANKSYTFTPPARVEVYEIDLSLVPNFEIELGEQVSITVLSGGVEFVLDSEPIFAQFIN